MNQIISHVFSFSLKSFIPFWFLLFRLCWRQDSRAVFALEQKKKKLHKEMDNCCRLAELLSWAWPLEVSRKKKKELHYFNAARRRVGSRCSHLMGHFKCQRWSETPLPSCLWPRVKMWPSCSELNVVACSLLGTNTLPIFLWALFEVNTFSQRGGWRGGGVTLRGRCYLVNMQLSSYKHKQNPVERLA